MTTTEPDLNALLAGLARGEDEAYRALVTVLTEPLHRYALSRLDDPAAAADIVQETFVRVYWARKKLSQVRELRGYCFSIARNLLASSHRAASRRKRHEEEKATMQPLQSSHTTPEQALLAQEAWALLGRLPDEEAEALELRFAHGLSRAEIAAALQTPEGTVATNQRTGLQRLRDLLQVSFAAAPLPAGDLGPLLEQGALSSISSMPFPHTPDVIAAMEEKVMASIKLIKYKTTATIAAACVVGVLLVGGAVYALTGGSGTPPAQPSALTAGVEHGRNNGGNQLQSVIDSPAPPSVTPKNPTPVKTARHIEGPKPVIEQPAPSMPAQPVVPPVAPTPADPPVERTPPSAAPDKPLNPAAAPVTVAPKFESEPVAKAIAGKEYVYLVKMSGQPAPTLKAENLPKWLTLKDNTLSGTPPDTAGGKTGEIALLASNGVKPDAKQTFVIEVSVAPKITSTAIVEAQSGKKYEYKIVATGTPAPTITANGLPTWLKFSGGAQGSGALSGTPGKDDAGETPTVTVRASNGIEPDAAQEFVIKVLCAPEFVSKAIETAKAGVEYKYEVKLSGYPAPTLSAKDLPEWLKLEGNILSGTPWNKHAGKTKSVALAATNGVEPDAKQSLRITIEKNTDFVDPPWTAEEQKKYVKKGLRWKFICTGAAVHSGLLRFTTTKIALIERIVLEVEVVEVTDTGFTIEWKSPNVEGAQLRKKREQYWWGQVPFYEDWEPFRGHLDGIRKCTIGKDVLKFGGNQCNCVVHTYKRNPIVVNGVLSDGISEYSFIENKPFMLARYCWSYGAASDKIIAGLGGLEDFSLTEIIEPK